MAVDAQLIGCLEALTNSEGAGAAPKSRREVIANFFIVDSDGRPEAVSVPKGILPIGLREIDALLCNADAVRLGILRNELRLLR